MLLDAFVATVVLRGDCPRVLGCYSGATLSFEVQSCEYELVGTLTARRSSPAAVHTSTHIPWVGRIGRGKDWADPTLKHQGHLVMHVDGPRRVLYLGRILCVVFCVSCCYQKQLRRGDLRALTRVLSYSRKSKTHTHTYTHTHTHPHTHTHTHTHTFSLRCGYIFLLYSD